MCTKERERKREREGQLIFKTLTTFVELISMILLIFL